MADDLEEALKELDITEDDIFREADAEIEQQLDETARKVESSWAELSPDDTGEYIRDLQITPIKDEKGRPARRVGDYSKHAHFVEYGTEDTPEFGVRAKVAVLYGNEGKYMV